MVLIFKKNPAWIPFTQECFKSSLVENSLSVKRTFKNHHCVFCYVIIISFCKKISFHLKTSFKLDFKLFSSSWRCNVYDVTISHVTVQHTRLWRINRRGQSFRSFSQLPSRFVITWVAMEYPRGSFCSAGMSFFCSFISDSSNVMLVLVFINWILPLGFIFIAYLFFVMLLSWQSSKVESPLPAVWYNSTFSEESF